MNKTPFTINLPEPLIRSRVAARVDGFYTAINSTAGKFRFYVPKTTLQARATEMVMVSMEDSLLAGYDTTAAQDTAKLTREFRVEVRQYQKDLAEAAEAAVEAAPTAPGLVGTTVAAREPELA